MSYDGAQRVRDKNENAVADSVWKEVENGIGVSVQDARERLVD